MHVKKCTQIIVMFGVTLCWSGISIADASAQQATISSVVDKLLKQEPDTLTETQRNAIGEGLYLLYCNNMSYETYLSTRQLLSETLKKIDPKHKAGERLLIVAARLGVDYSEISKHSAPYKDKNLFFVLSEIDTLGQAGLIVKARKLALNTTVKEFSFAESLGRNALLQIMKEFKITEPAKKIVLTMSLENSHLKFIHCNDLLGAITRLYTNIMCSGEEQLAFLKLKFRIVRALLKQRKSYIMMAIGLAHRRPLMQELDKENPKGSSSELPVKYRKILEQMQELEGDIEVAKETSRRTFYYDYNKFSENECEEIIKKGLIKFAEARPDPSAK